MRISKEKNSTIGNSDDKGLEVGACLSSRNGKEASVAVPGEREEKPAAGVGTLWATAELWLLL